MTGGRALVAAAFATLVADGASAQAYPTRPVRFIVQFPPGGTPDVVARILGARLTDRLGQQVVVDPRPGGSGVIATEIAKNASPDGHTLLMIGLTPFAVLPALKAKLPYDADRDFALLTRVASVANVLAVHPSLGAGTAAELVKIAKARPGQLNYGSAGNGSAQHIAGEMLNVLAGVKTVHVPYKGAALALNDLATGQVQYMISSPTVLMPPARAGRVRVIATGAPKRDPLLPELPAIADAVPGFESTLWWGVAVPAKTPGVIVARLHAEIVKAMQAPDVRDLLAKHSATAHAESPAEFGAFVKAERGRIARIAREVNITIE